MSHPIAMTTMLSMRLVPLDAPATAATKRIRTRVWSLAAAGNTTGAKRDAGENFVPLQVGAPTAQLVSGAKLTPSPPQLEPELTWPGRRSRLVPTHRDPAIPDGRHLDLEVVPDRPVVEAVGAGPPGFTRFATSGEGSNGRYRPVCRTLRPPCRAGA
jgi:hypothetical protein